MLIPACAARSEGCSLHLDSIDDDMLQLVLSFVDEPSDWAHAAAASRSMREAIPHKLSTLSAGRNPQRLPTRA